MEDNENIEYNLNKTSKRKDVTENIYDEINETEINRKKLTDSRKVIEIIVIFVYNKYL